MSLDQANDHPSHLNHPLVYLLSGRSHPIKPWLHGPLHLRPFTNLDLIIPEKKGKKKGVWKLHGAKLWKIRIMLSLGVRNAVERVRRIQHLLPKRSRKATRPLDTSPDVLC